MAWYSIFLDRKSDVSTIKTAMSSVFNVSKEEIILQFTCVDLSDTGYIDDNIKTAICISKFPGDFPVCMSIYL